MDASGRKLDKPPAFAVTPTRDGRLYVHLSFAATLSKAKAAVIVIATLLLLGYLSSPTLFGENNALRRRVRELETRMQKKVHWLLQHRQHLQEHVNSGWEPHVHEDGRRHLLSPPDGISKLAEALAPATELPSFDDHYLCGTTPAAEADVLKKKVALAAISYKSPLSLRNSMESWRAGGLLDVVDERMIFLNAPTEEDRQIARDFNFDIYEAGSERNGNIMAGPALAYLIGNTTADYVLMMEKDFVLTAPRETMMKELWVGMAHMARGVDVYRLRGKSDFPAEGMPDCCAEATPPNCPYHSNWKGAGSFADHMNWLRIFCDPNIMENSNGRLAQCVKDDPETGVTSYCFTSGESNWTNNPELISVDFFNQRLRDFTLHGPNSEDIFTNNGQFEFQVMMYWLGWRPPATICVSDQGIFSHFEVDQ